jgi:phosphoglucosamine mutase
MALRFGTDGVRGDAESQLTDDFVRTLGRVAAGVLGARRFVVARDTRASGPRIEGALAAGLAEGGCDVDLLGVVPTPAAAFLAVAPDTAGAIISASHNPWSDNGVKLFAPGGTKLADGLEAAVEAGLEAAGAFGGDDTAGGDGAGVIGERPELVDAYRTHLLESIGGGRLDGLRLALDCAHGAASALAPEVFESLGATVTVINNTPDGHNINDGCGSTHPQDLQRLVVGDGLDLGLAFDGDADRVLAVDEQGGVVDGDHIIGMCAIDRRDRGVLPGGAVVVTVMSNLGFRRGMEATGIRVVETAVGDRHVLAALDEQGLVLGGEQSGHVIFRDLATTGDGILTGLQVCDLLMRTGRYLSDQAQIAMTRYPQVLRNVRVGTPVPDVAERMAREIADEEVVLGGDGRVLVRASGTEPLIRVMVEAPTAGQAEAAADRLAATAARLFA